MNCNSGGWNYKKNKKLIIFFSVAFMVLFLCSCKTGKMIHFTIRTVPENPISPPPQKILLMNTYDVSPEDYRENKITLFNELLDDVLTTMQNEIRNNTGIETEVVKGITYESPDSMINLMKNYSATHAFSISYLNVSFDQTKVVVTETDKGKIRIAFYDIVSFNNYLYYSSSSEPVEPIKTPIRLQRFHSSRNVISGLLAAGPNIVHNCKQAYEITEDNVRLYLKYFFPRNENRERFIFTTDEFLMIGSAIDKGDFETAMGESHRLTQTGDYKIASKAYYNCAVLFERKNQPIEAKESLDKSIELFKGYFSVPEATKMMEDYH